MSVSWSSKRKKEGAKMKMRWDSWENKRRGRSVEERVHEDERRDSAALWLEKHGKKKKQANALRDARRGRIRGL